MLRLTLQDMFSGFDGFGSRGLGFTGIRPFIFVVLSSFLLLC